MGKEELKLIFDKLDTNSNGQLDADEVGALLERAGVTHSLGPAAAAASRPALASTRTI